MTYDYSNCKLESVSWPVPFGPGQPGGTVLTDGLLVALVYPSRDPETWVVLKFNDPWSVKYGTPNISELDSHPLCDRAKPGDLHIVYGSPWHEEARAMNAVHSGYNDGHWRAVRHYLAFLWDYTFECLATGFEFEEVRAPFDKVLEVLVAEIHVARGGKNARGGTA